MRRIIIAAAITTLLLFMVKKKDMTFRQSILKAVYPAIMTVGNWFNSKANIAENVENVQPPQSFYALKFASNALPEVAMSEFKGKKVLLVNTASDCGYTAQLKELQQLQNEFKDKLVVIGFPSNDFKEQETGSDKEIEAFCKLNYGVTFLWAKKSDVVKNTFQNEVFKWLTHKNKNGWNEQEPEWNFSKYLVNEQGILTYYFGSSVSPLSLKITRNL